MLVALLLFAGCVQSVDDVWADYDDALYLDGDEVEAACSEAPEAELTFETVWTVEARRENLTYLAGFTGDEFRELNCIEGSGERGSDHCWWPMERGDVVAISPIPVHVDCATGGMDSDFYLGALDRHGRTLKAIDIPPALD